MTFSYLTILFSDFSIESELKNELGWKGTFLFFFTLFGNMAVIVLIGLIKFLKAIRKLWRKKSKKKTLQKDETFVSLEVSVSKEVLIIKKRKFRRKKK